MDFIRVLSRTPVVFILTALEKTVFLIHMNDIEGSCKINPLLVKSPSGMCFPFFPLYLNSTDLFLWLGQAL